MSTKFKISEEQLTEEINIDFSLSITKIEEKFDTNSVYGLDDNEAQTRLEYSEAKHSYNGTDNLGIYKLLKNLIGIHNMPLWFGSALCAIVYLSENYIVPHDLEVKPDNFYISIGLMAFVFSFGIFSYYMDAKCEYYVESCRDFIPNYVTVIRDGIFKQILYDEVVVGDLIFFNQGDELQVDIKIVECTGVRINVEMLKHCETYFYNLIYGSCDRLFHVGDIIFGSSFIFSGYGKGVVTRCHNPYLCGYKQKFKHDTSLNDKRHSLNPLTVELNKFLNCLSIVSLITASCFSVSSLFYGYNWLRAVMFFIAIYVAIITEALLPTLNVAKTQISKELASKNCYIQNIEALETLGTTSIICTNKTGIITSNQMIVSKIWFDNQLMLSYEFMQQFRNTNLSEPVSSLVKSISLCIFARFSADMENVTPFRRNAIGKPSEVALLRFMEAFTNGLEKYKKDYKKCIGISFSARNKCSLIAYEKGEEFLLCIKGEPEALINHCRVIMTKNGLQKFSFQQKQDLLKLCSDLGRKKERIIGIVQAVTKFENRFNQNSKLCINDFDNILKNNKLTFQFLGLISFQNPVRLSVPEAIFKCRRAGIKVIMITADHPDTALSIAKTTGIVLHKNVSLIVDSDSSCETECLTFCSNVYTNKDLLRMKDHHLRKLISSNMDLVFARICPETKLRIVNCCRQVKSIVAVTGLGTSDLPIFDSSHVRISMGQYGSDITTKNSDVILLDDNFSSIVHGIEEGRVLFDNLKKSLVYTMSSKTPELLPYLFYLMLVIPKIASSITILAIDLFTDNLPAISLGYESAESHVMKVHPRHLKKEKIINLRTVFISLFFYGLIQFSSGFFSYIVVMSDNGFKLTDLINKQQEWYSMAVNDMEDSYGQEWTFTARKNLEMLCHTTYFTTVAITRIAVLFSCRTRRDSCFNGFFRNRMVNFAVFFVLLFSLFLAYYPPFEYSIQMYPLKLTWWFIGVPFFILMLILEELRKFIIRNYPNSEISQAIYY